MVRFEEATRERAERAARAASGFPERYRGEPYEAFADDILRTLSGYSNSSRESRIRVLAQCLFEATRGR